MWSNKPPKENGYYWLYERHSIDGEIKNVYKSIIFLYIDTNEDGSKYITVDEAGCDDPGSIPYKDPMVTETITQREPIFGFDSQETAYKKTKDLCERKYEYWLKRIITPSFEGDNMEPYEELHQEGMLSIEMDLPKGQHIGDVGIQVARDGRIWLCYNGQAFIRFKPLSNKILKILKKE